MSGAAFKGQGKAFLEYLGSLGKSKSKKSKDITSLTANKSDKMSKHKVDLAKIPGQTANRWKKSFDDADKIGAKVRQLTQKIKGEKKTESGISKGKDLKD